MKLVIKIIKIQIFNLLGRALDEIALATAPTASLLRNLQMGPNSGEFRITDRSRTSNIAVNINSNQIPQQNTQNASSQNVALSPQVIAQDTLQASNQIDRPINTSQSSQIPDVSQNIQQSQPINFNNSLPQINISDEFSSNDPRIQNATIGIVVGIVLMIILFLIIFTIKMVLIFQFLMNWEVFYKI